MSGSETCSRSSSIEIVLVVPCIHMTKGACNAFPGSGPSFDGSLRLLSSYLVLSSLHTTKALFAAS